jgi:hypothetical protein
VKEENNYPIIVIFVAGVVLFLAMCMLSEYGSFDDRQKAIMQEYGSVSVHKGRGNYVEDPAKFADVGFH